MLATAAAEICTHLSTIVPVDETLGLPFQGPFAAQQACSHTAAWVPRMVGQLADALEA